MLCYFKTANHESNYLMYNAVVSIISSTEKSQYALLTGREIIAMLEVLWHDHPYVKFNELIPKNADYTKQDAATVFYILLGIYLSLFSIMCMCVCVLITI